MPVALVALAVTAAAGAGVAAAGQNQARKGLNQSQSAADRMGNEYLYDVNKVSTDTSSNEYESLRRALATEKELTPETYAMRTQSIRQLLESGKPDEYTTMARARLGRESGGLDKTGTGRLSDYIMNVLESGKGGSLDTSTQNEVARQAGITASRVGGGSIGNAGAISARDLGLTSNKLLDQRLSQAQGITAQNEASKRADIGLLENMTESQYARAMNNAQFGQQLARPTGGLTNAQFLAMTEDNRNERIRANMAASNGLYGVGMKKTDAGQANYAMGTSLFGNAMTSMASMGKMPSGSAGGSSFYTPQYSQNMGQYSQAFTQQNPLGNITQQYSQLQPGYSQSFSQPAIGSITQQYGQLQPGYNYYSGGR